MGDSKKIYLPAPVLMEVLLEIVDGEEDKVISGETLMRETGLWWERIWRPLKYLEKWGYVEVLWNKRGHRKGAEEIKVLRRKVPNQGRTKPSPNRGDLSDETLNMIGSEEASEADVHLRRSFLRSVLEALLELFDGDSSFPEKPHFHDILGGVRRKLGKRFRAFFNEEHLKGIVSLLREEDGLQALDYKGKKYYKLDSKFVRDLLERMIEKETRAKREA